MKKYKIQEFRCYFCSEWFNSNFRLPLKLNCGHSVCKSCILDNHNNNHHSSYPIKIMCPEDYQLNIYKSINDIQQDVIIKHILERVSGESIIKKSSSKLEQINEYQKLFEALSFQITGQLKSVNKKVDEIYEQQISRIESIWTKVKIQLNRPLKIIQDWKQLVKAFLITVKHSISKGNFDFDEFEHYITEAKKIYDEITLFFSIDKESILEKIQHNKTFCFRNDFSFFGIEKKPTLDLKSAHEKLKVNIKKNTQQDYSQLESQELKNSSYLRECQKEKQNFNSFKERISKKNSQNLEEIKKKIENSYNNCISPKLKILSPTIKILSPSALDNLSSLRASLNCRNANTNYKIEGGNIDKVATSIFELPYNNIVKTCPSPKQNLQKNGNSIIEISDSNLNQIQQMNEQMLLSTYERDQRDNSIKMTFYEEDIQLLQKIQNNLQKKENLINFYKSNNNNNDNNSIHPLQIRKKGPFETHLQKSNNYTTKMKIMKVQQAFANTVIGNNFIELISHPIQQLDFFCYLSIQNWTNQIQILKFVKVNLQDQQLNILLNFVMRYPNIHTLVISSNQLTEDSVDILLEFFETNRQLKNIYLAKNYINLLKCKQKINILKSYQINIYI